MSYTRPQFHRYCELSVFSSSTPPDPFEGSLIAAQLLLADGSEYIIAFIFETALIMFSLVVKPKQFMLRSFLLNPLTLAWPKPPSGSPFPGSSNVFTPSLFAISYATRHTQQSSRPFTPKSFRNISNLSLKGMRIGRGGLRHGMRVGLILCSRLRTRCPRCRMGA